MMVFAAALLVLVSAGALYQAIGARRSARLHVCPGTLIDAGGRRLHVVTAGAGAPAVVFEAGIAASSLSWAHVLPEIAKTTRACAYDRAGLAWSDPCPQPHALADILADLDGVVANAGIPHPFIMVGHSFGCFVACAYAARHPSAVAGLVLVDPPATSEWHEPTPQRRRLLRRGIRLSHVGGVLARLGVGSEVLSNLELRCRPHNAHEAELFFGGPLPGFVRETPAAWGVETRSGPSPWR